jgi:hypothetical protein
LLNTLAKQHVLAIHLLQRSVAVCLIQMRLLSQDASIEQRQYQVPVRCELKCISSRNSGPDLLRVCSGRENEVVFQALERFFIVPKADRSLLERRGKKAGFARSFSTLSRFNERQSRVWEY